MQSTGKVIGMGRMTIGKAAHEAGVQVGTIRFYERKGLIDRPPKPLDGVFRDYPWETIQRVRFIREAQQLGFSLREIGELLSLRADPSTDCADVRDRARIKLEEIGQKIAQLSSIQRALRRLVASCPGEGALEACSILDALEDAEKGRASSETRSMKHA